VLVFRLLSQPFVGFESQSPFPALHEIPHTPATHVGVAPAAPAHTRPHTPQLAMVVFVFTSHPLVAFASQFAYPAMHANPQTPDTHELAAFARAGHAAPHMPQWDVLVFVFVSQPELVVQSPQPALHMNPHRPAVHTALALTTPGHAVLHAPQLASSVWTSTHDVPHNVRGAQLSTHEPALQNCPAGHARPHIPQWVELVFVFTSQPVDAARSQSA